MIVGIGIDIQAVEKIAQSLHRPAFIRKVFTPSEIALCQAKPRAAEHFAGKFAAKEAAMKALGAGIRQGIWFTDIEVLNHASGAPYLNFYRTAHDLYANLGIQRAHVTLSHSQGIAVGVVILEI